jgi:hypothetical protein
MREADAMTKVQELMIALDEVKKYRILFSSLRPFAIAVGASIIAYISIRLVLAGFGVYRPYSQTLGMAVSLLALVIPIAVTIVSVIAVKKRIRSIKTGQWQAALNEGLPGAFRILSEIDWEGTFDEISLGRLGYIFFGVLKAIAYAVMLFFVLESTSAIVLGHFFGVRILLAAVLWAFVSIVIVALIQSNDLIRRYRKGRALDFLLWDLRWFSFEFGRAAEEIFGKS